jgi:hypothetical protein
VKAEYHGLAGEEYGQHLLHAMHLFLSALTLVSSAAAASGVTPAVLPNDGIFQPSFQHFQYISNAVFSL